MTAPCGACAAHRRSKSAPPAHAVRLPRVGLRGVLVACLAPLAAIVVMPVGEGDAAWRKPAPASELHPPAGWRVQLGAFSSEPRAAKARKALAQTLADLPWAGVPVMDDSKGDGLFRVVLADTFAHRGEATAACAAISAHGAECFVAGTPVSSAASGATGLESVPAAQPPPEEEAAGRRRADVPAPAPGAVLERLDALEAENRRLRKEMEALKAERIKPLGVPPSRANPAAEPTATRFVRTDSKFGYAVLDPTTNINRKQRLILDRQNDGTLAPFSLHVHGALTAIANYQSSNRDDKFGYLMRHPTAKNQIGDSVSEAAIHSAQIGFTGTLGYWLTGHAEMLFDPEQSFGDGTNTDIDRNQLQMRRAYVLFGDRRKSPFFASLGKMAVPFGLTDTVNPFSASTVWHVFGGLANGVTVGYERAGLNLSVMGIQGGAQFRAANTPVNGTAVPGRLNNFAADASYSFGLGSSGSLLLGGSYQHGTAYCQGFPIVHFGACEENNPAFDVYGRLVYDDLTLKGEFAQTTEVWPGTFNPGMPQFAASEVMSFDIGAKYKYGVGSGLVDLSAEFSRLVAGPDGAPWERQDQFVLGAAWFARSNAKLFAEYIHVKGYTPLSFLSGGSVMDDRGEIVPDQTHSDRSARSDVFITGVNVAF